QPQQQLPPQQAHLEEILDMPSSHVHQEYHHYPLPSHQPQVSHLYHHMPQYESKLHFEDLMSKLDHDNKVLAELDRRIIDRSLGMQSYGHSMYARDALTGHLRPHSSLLPASAAALTTIQPPTIQASQPQPLIFLPLNNLIGEGPSSHAV